MIDFKELSQYKIVTLCGSTKFKKEFEYANSNLTFNNIIVLQPGCFAHYDNIEISSDQKIKLDILHKEKILMSNCILVINVNNYIGDSTRSEIEYAKSINKPIFYLYKHILHPLSV